MLTALYDAESGVLSLSNSTPSSSSLASSTATVLAFLKNPNCPSLSSLPLEAYSSHITTTSIPTNSTPLNSLATAIHSFYAPYLLSGDSNLPEKFKDLLHKVDASLQSTTSSEGGSASNSDEKDFSSVRTAADELHFWENFRGRSVPKSIVNEIRDQLRGVEDTLNILSKSSQKHGTGRAAAGAAAADGNENEDTTNHPAASSPTTLLTLEALVSESSTLEGALLNIFKVNDAEDNPPYPPTRMRNTLDVLSSGLVAFARAALPSSADLFGSPYTSVKGDLKLALNLISSYSRMASKLTEIDFRDSDHPWEGDIYESSPLRSFEVRLKSILDIRTTQEELKNLLPKSQRAGFERSDPFRPLVNFGDCLLTSIYTDGKWSSAVSEYEGTLSTAEATIGNDLKAKVKHLSGRPILLLSSLRRYSNLLRR